MALSPWREVVGNLERVSTNGPLLEVYLRRRDGMPEMTYTYMKYDEKPKPAGRR